MSKSKNLIADSKAGSKIALFLALPLSLGVAAACGFPIMSGVISSIVSGIVMSIVFLVWQGTPLNITGPAAGMITVVLFVMAGFQDLVSENLSANEKATFAVKSTLAVGVIGGAIQMGLALFSALNLKIAGYPINLGWLGNFFPPAVIAGMKCAIGLILILSQGLKVIGIKPEHVEPKEILFHITEELEKFEPSMVVLTGIICLSLIFFLSNYADRSIFSLFPPSLIVLGIGILIPLVLHTKEIPTILIPADYSQWFLFPDFSLISSSHGIISICLYVGVPSIESLVTSVATQAEDPEKRQPDMNADIFANGLANLILGFIGGLPIINEVVRSHNNVHEGAKTQKSNLFHSLVLVMLVVSMGSYLSMIPNVTLSALLVYTGYAMVKKNVGIMKVGRVEVAIMVITVLSIILTDLLVGVLLGMGIYMIVQYANVVKFSNTEIPTEFFKIKNKNIRSGEDLVISIDTITIFNVQKIISLLREKITTKLVLTFDRLNYIDSKSYEILQNYRRTFVQSGGKLDIHGLELLQPFSSHPLAARGRSYKETGEIPLNKRQLSLKSEGERYGFTFDRASKVHNFILEPFKLFETQSKQVKNLLEGEINSCHVLIFDISTDKFSGLASKQVKYSGFVIDFGSEKKIPNFIQTKEKLLSKFDSNDIDFAQYPEYSAEYLLKSDQPEETKKMFLKDDGRLLKKFTNYSVHYMEAVENQLFIIRKSRENREDQREFPENLASIIDLVDFLSKI